MDHTKCSIKFYNISMIIDIAPPKTVWHFTHQAKDSPLQRQDHIFSLCRVWVRTYKKYVWELRIGRIQILLANNKQ